MVVVDVNSNIKWKKIKLLNATTFQGRIQDFKLGGGEGWWRTYKNYAKKSYFFQLRR